MSDQSKQPLTILDCLRAERAVVYDDIFRTVTIAVYELGAVGQNLIYALRAVDSSARNGYHANALLELSDLLTQAGILMEKIKEETPEMTMQPSWDELVAIGRVRQIDRLKRIAASEQRPPSMSEA